MNIRTLTALALSIGLTAGAVAPALADGAASTRNILIGGAAVAGTLLIINHNKKVHEKYAEDARNQAAAENSAANAQAAYASERTAYEHEAALVGEYKHEVALQHTQIVSLRHQVATTDAGHTAFTQPARPIAPARTAVASSTNEHPLRVASVSYGWGQL